MAATSVTECAEHHALILLKDMWGWHVARCALCDVKIELSTKDSSEARRKIRMWSEARNWK